MPDRDRFDVFAASEMAYAIGQPPVELKRDHVLYVWVVLAVALSVFAVWMLV
jgi:hypothetical protein